MKKIPLTKGYEALVDDEDYDFVNQFKWSAYIHNGNQYAVRGANKRCAFDRLHRLIMNAPKGTLVDHINGNGLDNRRSNLRLCTQAENLRNRGRTKANLSGFKGVTFHKQNQRWMAQLKHNYAHVYIGTYDTPQEAAKAYDQAALQYFGEFASLNFPQRKPNV